MMDGGRGVYRPPTCLIKTSAEIIREARAEMATRPVNTKRPFTPIDRQRKLFGPLKANTSRPPSAFSLRQVEFEDVDSSTKLPPLRTPGLGSRSCGKPLSWRLPSLTSRITSSLSNLPEEVEVEEPIDVWAENMIRQTHSSPQERTDFSEVRSKARGTLSLSSSFPAGLKNRNHLRRMYAQYKPFSGRLGRVGGSISETDETEDVQTLSLDIQPLEKSRSTLFRTPKIEPLIQDAAPMILEPDLAVEDNKKNERKMIDSVQTVEKSTSLADLLVEISESHGKGASEQEIIPLIEKLYIKIKTEGKNKINNKQQSQIIKLLYKFVESASDSLLLYISKVMLVLKVIGQNLAAVTKLIFKVSRCDKNDSLFLEGNLIELFVEALGRASPIDDAEACIYGYGALKFLTMNQQLLLVSLKLGILDLMVLHLKIVNNARLELQIIPEQSSHGMFQLTGTLRNVASEELTLQHFVKTGAVGQLCTLMELFSADLDLISNVARTISILTTHDECCEAVMRHENCFRSITKILNKYPGRQDIVVRFGYALGNIITKSDEARIKLYREPGAFVAITNLLESYLEKDLEQMGGGGAPGPGSLPKSPEWASDGSVEDVIVKMIRIVANMSMHPEVGIGMTCLPVNATQERTYSTTANNNNAKEGSRFLELLLMVLRRKSVQESEELVMSTLSTLNNLSYYATPGVSSTQGPFAMRQIEITQVLSTLLLTRNEECVVEVTRVLGNLSRSKDVRDYILEIGGIGQLVRCLEYGNKELLFTVTGVLVNLMADWDKRLALKEANGIHKLIVVLKTAGEGDWRLASLVCQALWNFCIDSTHLYAALGIQAVNDLLAILVDLLDEEKLFGVSEETEAPEAITDSAEYRLWEQFARVATNLLEKIEQYLEVLQGFDNQ